MKSFPPPCAESLGSLMHVRATVAVLLTLTVGVASAQTIYKSVGPDGKVMYSDRLPAEQPSSASAKATGLTTGSSATDPGNTANSPALPYELKQLSSKYPVTLYTTSNCTPCDTGRAMLSQRGVPFTEKTVNTSEDIRAFVRINPDNSMPLLTIGGQTVKGFSDTEWSQYLDSAGYPKQSSLPARYRQPAAEPLSPLKTATDSGTNTAADSVNNSSAPKPTTTKPVYPTDRSSNPAGIRF